MIYLVALQPDSAIGRIYLHSKDYEHLLTDGQLSYPTIACTELQQGNPNYISALRTPSARNARRGIHLPHHNVAAIFERGDEDATPIGFLNPPSGSGISATTTENGRAAGSCGCLIYWDRRLWG